MADFCLSAAENLKKVKHLLDLPKASTNLTLLKADLTEEGSFDEAIHGCHGVFHVATPMDFESKDPENEVIKPTIDGFLSIIRSCVKALTVKKLVFTSYAGTVDVQQHKTVYDENDWSDLDFINSIKMTGWVRVLYPKMTGCRSKMQMLVEIKF